MKDKKTVFCVIGQLGNGGSEKQLYLFLKYLDKEKYSPIVIVCSDEEGRWNAPIRNELNIPVISLEGLPSPLKLLKFRFLTLKYKPSSILSWSFYTNVFNTSSGSSKFIGTLRGDLYTAKEQMSGFHWKQCLKPSCFFVNSSKLTSQLQKEIKEKQKIFTIFNIFEQDSELSSEKQRQTLRNEARKKYDLPEDSILIAGIGKNIPAKDLPFFLDVFAAASEKNALLRAMLIGKHIPSLDGDVKKRGLEEKIILTGEVKSASQLLPVADIYFLSSKSEGMPNALLEAINAHCATLATDVGGVKDILGGDENPYFDAILLPNRDKFEAAAKLLQLAEKSGLRKKIAEENQRRLQLFSPGIIMQQFIDMMEMS